MGGSILWTPALIGLMEQLSSHKVTSTAAVCSRQLGRNLSFEQHWGRKQRYVLGQQRLHKEVTHKHLQWKGTGQYRRMFFRLQLLLSAASYRILQSCVKQGSNNLYIKVLQYNGKVEQGMWCSNSSLPAGKQVSVDLKYSLTHDSLFWLSSLAKAEGRDIFFSHPCPLCRIAMQSMA